MTTEETETLQDRVYRRIVAEVDALVERHRLDGTQRDALLDRACRTYRITYPRPSRNAAPPVAVPEPDPPRPLTLEPGQVAGWRVWWLELDGRLESAWSPALRRLRSSGAERDHSDQPTGSVVYPTCPRHKSPPSPHCGCGVYCCTKPRCLTWHLNLFRGRQDECAVIARVIVTGAMSDPVMDDAVRGSRMDIVGPIYTARADVVPSLRRTFGCRVVYTGEHLPTGEALRRLISQECP